MQVESRSSLTCFTVTFFTTHIVKLFQCFYRGYLAVPFRESIREPHHTFSCQTMQTSFNTPPLLASRNITHMMKHACDNNGEARIILENSESYENSCRYYHPLYKQECQLNERLIMLVKILSLSINDVFITVMIKITNIQAKINAGMPWRESLVQGQLFYWLHRGLGLLINCLTDKLGLNKIFDGYMGSSVLDFYPIFAHISINLSIMMATRDSLIMCYLIIEQRYSLQQKQTQRQIHVLLQNEKLSEIEYYILSIEIDILYISIMLQQLSIARQGKSMFKI